MEFNVTQEPGSDYFTIKQMGVAADQMQAYEAQEPVARREEIGFSDPEAYIITAPLVAVSAIPFLARAVRKWASRKQ